MLSTLIYHFMIVLADVHYPNPKLQIISGLFAEWKEFQTIFLSLAANFNV